MQISKKGNPKLQEPAIQPYSPVEMEVIKNK